MTFKEPVNTLSHMFGAVLSVIGLVLLIKISVSSSNTSHLVAFSIYGTSLILLYCSSSLYHGLFLSEKGERILKRMDHILIFILIAGSYTPYCLIPLAGPWGYAILCVVWAMAIAGVFLKIFALNMPRHISTIIYVIMGWTCIFALPQMIKTLPFWGMFWTLVCGMFYTVGAAIYGLKRPNPWPGVFGFHEIWHFCVLLGSACQFWVMFRYVAPMG